MELQLIDDCLRVVESGYTWGNSSDGKHRVLRPKLPDGKSLSDGAWVKIIPFPILREKALFKDFSDIKENAEQEEAILDFANNYGMLCGAYSVKSIGLPEREETFKEWRDEIAAMSRAKRLCEAMKRQEGKGLDDYIVWKQDRIICIFAERKNEGESPMPQTFDGYTNALKGDQNKYIGDDRITIAEDGGKSNERFILLTALRKSESLLKANTLAANFFFQYLINDKITPVITSNGDSVAMPEIPLEVRILRNPKDNTFHFHVVARNLRAILWLQFARWAFGVDNWKPCKYCGDWFLGNNRRSDAESHPKCKRREENKRNRATTRVGRQKGSIPNLQGRATENPKED